MNQLNQPTLQDLTSVGVPYKQAFVIDVRRYQDLTDNYEATLLHRTGFNIESIFSMAFRLFSLFSPARKPGCPPDQISSAALSTIVDSVQPFRTAIKHSHGLAVNSGSCGLSYDSYKRLVNDNVIRMYLVIYPFLVNMYVGLINHYQISGAVMETINVVCQHNRIYFGVFNVL